MTPPDQAARYVLASEKKRLRLLAKDRDPGVGFEQVADVELGARVAVDNSPDLEAGDLVSALPYPGVALSHETPPISTWELRRHLPSRREVRGL